VARQKATSKGADSLFISQQFGVLFEGDGYLMSKMSSGLESVLEAQTDNRILSDFHPGEHQGLDEYQERQKSGRVR
jgi:hypothetical protein